MSCNCFCSDFSKTLQYVSPAHGGWGVIRVAALVPKSHLLFVAPSACGRHGALGGLESGIKDRISYLYIDESDIVSGNYENLIFDAVNELFDFLVSKPKALFVFVSCLDDLLGTDNDVIISHLSELYPDVEFRSCHMNPISMDTANPPGVTLLNSMYDLVERQETKKQINLVGNNYLINKNSELFNLLKDSGYSVLQLGECETYEEFQQIGCGCLNVLMRPVAKKACKTMENKLGIPTMSAFPEYNIEFISSWYEQLADTLKIPHFDYSLFLEKAREKINSTKQLVGTIPIAVDYQAVLQPFGLARALLDYGFNVKLIVTKECLGIDLDNKGWILANHHDVQIVNAMHFDQVKFSLRGTDYLCIGFDCGYMTGSVHISPLMDDEGLFGFDGVCRLMDEIERTFKQESDVHKMIEEAGLVI